MMKKEVKHMNGEDVMIIDKKHCHYAKDARDVDGDWDTYCGHSGHCQYQKNVKDVDGGIISLCRL